MSGTCDRECVYILTYNICDDVGLELLLSVHDNFFVDLISLCTSPSQESTEPPPCNQTSKSQHGLSLRADAEKSLFAFQLRGAVLGTRNSVLTQS